MDMIGWLAAFVILIGIEAATMALTTIWFAGGAVAAFLAAVLGVPVQVQLVVFLIVSFVLYKTARYTVCQPGDREDERKRADRAESESDRKDRQ